MDSGQSDVSTASGDPNDTQENFDDLGAALVINDFLWVVPRAAKAERTSSDVRAVKMSEGTPSRCIIQPRRPLGRDNCRATKFGVMQSKKRNSEQETAR